jgi:hypothetical protein
MASGNWRSSMTSSAATSTSAFTRFSNSSMRSVSTTATSLSASSWRTHGNAPPSVTSKPAPAAGLPKNIKYMTRMPWELDQLPRGYHANPASDMSVRKHRVRKHKEVPLDTISERPGNASLKSPVLQRRDASTSTTDLAGVGKEDIDSPKKVQRGQINALAKMLSALRR